MSDIDPYVVPVKEAARLLSSSPAYIHALINNGTLPACYHTLAKEPEPGKRDNRKKYIHITDVEAYSFEMRNQNAA